MAKDKYDFIHELLNNKKLSTTQRERILLLTSEEIKNDKEYGNILEERVKKIEDKLGITRKYDQAKNTEVFLISGDVVDDKTQSLGINKDSDISLNKYYHPSTLYKFLFEYNQNRVLKSTCHEIDANALEDILDYCKTDTYDFNKHLEIISTAFEEHDKKYFCAPSTKALIRGYITGKDYQKNEIKQGWSSDKIKINWAHNELLKWATENKIPPNSTQEIFKNSKIRGFDFDGFTSGLFGKRVQTFRELVLHFKSLFHIRSDNSLKSILSKINELKDFSNLIEFDLNETIFPINIELFTDVDKLIQGYVRIIELIIEQHQKDSVPKVKMAFYESGNTVCLSIHHLNNTYNKSIQNTIERTGQTYTNLINKQLNGMCNFYLRADFGHDGLAKINLWNGKNRTVIRNELEAFTGGVEHILEFFKC